MSIVATDPPPKRLASPGEFMELAMPLDVHVCVSNEDFVRLCQANPDLRLERSAGGELIIMAPVGTEGGGRNASLTAIDARTWTWLRKFLLHHPGANLGAGAPFSTMLGLPQARVLSQRLWSKISGQRSLCSLIFLCSERREIPSTLAERDTLPAFCASTSAM